MYHRMRRKLQWRFLTAIIIVQGLIITTHAKNIYTTESNYEINKDDLLDNIIDFDDELDIKFDKKYNDNTNWKDEGDINKESYKYKVVNKPNLDSVSTQKDLINDKVKTTVSIESTTDDMSVIPLELLSTTENYLISILESTTEQDLTVIPLSTTKRSFDIEVPETVTLPSSTDNNIYTTDIPEELTSTVKDEPTEKVTKLEFPSTAHKQSSVRTITATIGTTSHIPKVSTLNTTKNNSNFEASTKLHKNNTRDIKTKDRNERFNETRKAYAEYEAFKNSTNIDKKNTKDSQRDTINGTERSDIDSSEEGVPIFTALDVDESIEVADDYYDTKDVVPTKAPSNDALSVIFGLAGSVVESVVESVAERVVPRGIFDLFKRMQKQSEALEAERLRSREENGGLGQFGRGILKTISTGLTKPFTQLMAGAKDIGSLDNDRSFVSGLVSGVSNVASVANSLADTFKDRVQAIYPGTLWCGDGHVAQARSGDLGLFFFTDTCCRQHDACKIYIRAGDTKYNLTNTGLFTRSHCSCDKQFRECLQKTGSLVSGQIGLTYFNVLGPQCFRKAHPIVKCLRRTRLTGQKCEEYDLDYTKPKMWQWFDNVTY